MEPYQSYIDMVLQLTRKTDYALLALATLAKDFTPAEPGGTHARASSRAISDRAGLPLPVTTVVLKAMASAGLVESIRGANGGYRLARPPKELRVLEVVTAIEGAPELTACCQDLAQPSLNRKPDQALPEPEHELGCAHADTCSIRGGLRRLHQDMVALLHRTTLADLMAGPAPEHQPRTPSVFALALSNA